MAKKLMIDKRKDVYISTYSPLSSIRDDIASLIREYGEDATLIIESDYDVGSVDFLVRYKEEESDEAFETRIAAEKKARAAKKEEAKRLKELRDAADYQVYLELKERYEK